MGTIAKLFGKSPFIAFHEHMLIAKSCAEKVIPLMEAYINGETDKYKTIASEIYELETNADDVKNELRDNLPSSILLPVSRHDLLVALDYQDSIADRAQDIGVILTLKEIPVPENMKDILRDFVESAVKVCYLASEISAILCESVSRFGVSANSEDLLEMVNELSKLESENDHLGHQMMRDIFEKEDELSGVEIFLWFRLIKLIGDLADFAQKTANRMRSLIAK